MEKKSTFWKSAMIYGLYIGIVLTLFSVILYVTGQSTNKSLGYISFPLYIICIVFAQIHYRNTELNGEIRYGQAVGFATAAMLFSGIISALYMIILYSFIDPGLIDQMKALQEEAMLQRGMTEDQIEAAMAISSKMFTPGWMSIMGLISSVVMGTIVSLVSSIFIKKEPNEDSFDEAMEEVKTEE
jgi:hypothetical protein